MASIFISYSKQARRHTEELARWLEGQNFSVWWDKALVAGDRYPTEIRRQLIGARAGIVVWSRPALESKWVYAEAVEAARVGNIVPVLADDVKVTELPLPFNAGDHAISIQNRPALVESITKRMSGILEPATVVDKRFDPRWAGLWLLDPQQRPYNAEDALTSPASLLLARHALVRFEEVDGELSDFTGWASQSSRRVCGRVLEGAGGLGKTRLMIEACARLADDGWLTGFVPGDIIGQGNELRENRLRDLIEDQSNPRPILLVVDYAETRREEIDWLCRRLLHRRDNSEGRARLVLISRAAGEWWTELFADPDVQKLFSQPNGQPDIVSLDRLSLGFDREKRHKLFESSVVALKEIIRGAGRATPEIPPSAAQIERVLSGDDNNRPLAIQLEALLYLYGEAPEEGQLSIDRLLDRVLDLEKLGWERRLKIQTERQRKRRIARGVCQATLAVGIDQKTLALDLLKRTEGCSDEQADSMHYELHVLYGRTNGGLHPLEPDLIGEHHVGGTVDDKLVDTCLDWANGDVKRRQAILTVLNRTTRSGEHGEKAKVAIDQLKRLWANSELREDMWAVAIGTPGQLKSLIADWRAEIAAPAQEIGQRSTREERVAEIAPPFSITQQNEDRTAPRKEAVRIEPGVTSAPRFFISHASSDMAVARVIRTLLEERGFAVSTSDEEFHRADHFSDRFTRALESDERVIALLSPHYLSSRYANAEVTRVLADDPMNSRGRLIPLRIAPCRPEGVLSSLAYWDLVPLLDEPVELRDALAKALSASTSRHAPADARLKHGEAILHPNIRAQSGFVAREGELLAIDGALWSGGASIIGPVVIAKGMAGIGKSALAREYAWQARDGYAGVWWLDASREDALVEGLIELGNNFSRNLGRSADKATEARGVLDFLAHGGFEKPWLLIFDNLEDEALLEKWRPPRDVRVIVTTRLANSNSELPGRDLNVDVWTLEQAVQYLQTTTQRQDISEIEAMEVAQALGCLPLALSHAASYLRARTSISVRSYLQDLLGQLSRVPHRSQYPMAVAATFKQQIDLVEAEAPGSKDVLCLVAFLAPEQIPEAIFLQNPTLYPPQLALLAGNEDRLMELLGQLAQYSLISRDVEGRSFSVHRLVQLAARDLASDQEEVWVRTAMRAVAAALSNIGPEGSRVMLALAPHALQLASFAKPNDDAYELARCVLQSGESTAGYADISERSVLYESARRILELKAAGDPDSSTWQHDLSVARGRTGDLLRSQGNLPAALDAYKASLTIREHLAAVDPGNASWQRELAVSYGKIGDIHLEQGDLQSALDAYKISLAIAERLAAGDPGNSAWQRDLAVSLEQVAEVFRVQGDLPAALERYRASLAIFERLAVHDPGNAGWLRDLSVTQGQVGDVLVQQGDLQAALRAYNASLAILERLAAADPGNAGWMRDMSASHGRIGDVLTAMGDLPGALRSFQTALSAIERIAEADRGNAAWQRDLSVSLNRIGSVLERQGNLVDALNRYRQADVVIDRIMASDPSNAGWQRDFAISRSRIGRVYEAMGKRDEAFMAFSTSLTIFQTLSERDPRNTSAMSDLAIAHNNLGDLKLSAGEHREAVKAFVLANALAERLARADPSNATWQRDLALSLGRMGIAQASLGDFDKARTDLTRGREIIAQLQVHLPENSTWARDLAWFDSRLGEIE